MSTSFRRAPISRSSDGALRLSEPRERHGARLPFDFLPALAGGRDAARGPICVILSGTGADGSLGLKAVKEKGGLVIVQDPEEAGYDGMPRSAIMTGAVDLVLPVAEIPEALVKHSRKSSGLRAARPTARNRRRATAPIPRWPRSSISCARRPRTISPSTSRARCCAGSSGAWRSGIDQGHRRLSRHAARQIPPSSSFSPRIC